MTNWLFRGTSRGYGGSAVFRSLIITSTSTDPLVATLFAVECQNHGQAVVHIADRSNIPAPHAPANVLADIESEVALTILPADFAKCAVWTVDAQDAVDTLIGMGFPLPRRIADHAALNAAVNLTPRLSDDQIEEFVRRVAGVVP